MIPLRDANPTRRTPVVTLGLIVACFVVFAWELGLQATSEASLNAFVTEWGVVPRELLDAWGDDQIASQETATLVTSQFLHGGWLHLIGNMLYLWIFGNNIEDRLGRVLFLLFYLAGGVIAALTQVAVDPDSTVPLIGASGAIAATLGAYLVLFPGARITTLVFLGFFYQLINVPAVVVLGFWFVLQLLDGVGQIGRETGAGGIAFFAHIGGFVAGAAVGWLLRVGRTPALRGRVG